MNNSLPKEKSCFRSFSLYNYRNPSVTRQKTEQADGFLRFNTLGYFDEFRTKSIDIMEKTGNMPELWQGIKSMNSALIDDEVDGFSAKSYQNIFGYPIPSECLGESLRSENGMYVTDDAFWSDHENPYIFTILIQFFDSSDNSDNTNAGIENKIKTYIKKYLEHIKKNLDQYNEIFAVDDITRDDNEKKRSSDTETDHKAETENSAPEIEDLTAKEILTLTDEEKKFIFTGYITYDKYDYILCVKTKCYLPFVLATQQLYSLFSADSTKECFSVSSFTVTAIDSSCAQRIANERAPSICIKCTYNESNIYYYNKMLIERIKEDERKYKFNVLNYMDNFQKQLKTFLYSEEEQQKLNKRDNYFRMYFISGENDIRFIARYVQMEKLIKLFTDISSPLNDNYLGGFSTSINVTNKDVHNFTPEEIQTSNHSLVSKIIECKHMIETIAEKRCPEELVKTMYQINSGLSAIMPLNANYRSYAFLSLFPDYYSFLKRMYGEIIRTDRIIRKKELDDAQDLMQYIGAALLTTIRSDFKEFQVPTFNANLYYTPTKLLVFYRAFIVNFLNYYESLYCKSAEEDGFDSAQKSIQHFIVVPGNQFGATVFEKAGGVYDDGATSERFFVCEISEKNVYCIKTSLIILSHEISHFGLKKIRNRRNRYEHIWMSYITSFVVYFLGNLYQKVGRDPTFVRLMPSSFAKMLLFDTCIFTSKMKQRLTEKIRIKYEIYDSEFRKRSHNQKNKYHYDKIQLMLERNFNNLHKEIKDFITSEICVTVQNYLLSVSTLSIDEKILLNESIIRIVNEAFEATFKTCLTRYNDRMIASPHSFISYHYKEVFSDVFCVITLDLHPEDYHQTVFHERSHQVMNTNSKSVLYRIALVIDGINTAITKLRDMSNPPVPFSFVEDTFKSYKWWLTIVSAAGKEIKLTPIEQQTFNQLINHYKSVQNRLFDVFAVPVSNEQYSSWYREIQGDRKNASRVLFYDKNIYEYFVDYLTNCIISYFVENYKIEASRAERRSRSPSEIFSNINSEHIEYYQKMKTMDEFLCDFENNQLARLNHSE